jgi:polyferredoxin
MNAVKRYLGILWLAIAALAGYFGLFSFGIPKLTTGKTDDLVFGLIIVFVLMPIIVGGLIRFGLCAIYLYPSNTKKP